MNDYWYKSWEVNKSQISIYEWDNNYGYINERIISDLCVSQIQFEWLRDYYYMMYEGRGIAAGQSRSLNV